MSLSKVSSPQPKARIINSRHPQLLGQLDQALKQHNGGGKSGWFSFSFVDDELGVRPEIENIHEVIKMHYDFDQVEYYFISIDGSHIYLQLIVRYLISQFS
jgi:hypothetical protein